MRFKRKVIEYDADQTDDGNWVVINLQTNERKIVSNRDFRKQFEPIKTEAPKPEPRPKPQMTSYAPVPYEIDPETGDIVSDLIKPLTSIREDLK